MNRKIQPSWLKPLVDYGPLITFFAAYYAKDLFFATAAIMIATVCVISLSLLFTHKVPAMPLVTAIAVGIFGGLTLFLKDETFIKMKPTIVEVLIAAILLGGLFFKKLFLKSLIGNALPMIDEGWQKLTSRFAYFSLGLAILNEIVWRTQSTEVWVNFKVWGLMVLTFVFILAQMPLIQRYGVEKNSAEHRDQ
ncbi:MAG: septation protein A [Rhodospirillaceae bacterium]|jgi:intracellular septation protein